MLVVLHHAGHPIHRIHKLKNQSANLGVSVALFANVLPTLMDHQFNSLGKRFMSRGELFDSFVDIHANHLDFVIVPLARAGVSRPSYFRRY
jgi:hypothetical protein